MLVQTDSAGLAISQRLADGFTFSATPPVIAIARKGNIGDAVCAMRAGVIDYLVLDANSTADLRAAIVRAVRQSGIHQGVGNGTIFEEFISTDHRTRAVCDRLAHIADSPATLLLQGESGVGKTLLAELVHQHSARRIGPFVEVSCGALSESLLESELFGHARGSFTSAYRKRRGKFEVADGGTMLLDEIGSASMGMQARLLRVVESGRFERIGDTDTLQTDARIIVITKRPLEQLVLQGLFREDLFHRLNAFKIELCPLRKRVEDIPLLARHFLRIFAAKHKRQVTGFEPETMSRLVHYRWPGNVRELRNIVERSIILAADGLVQPASLPDHIADTTPPVHTHRRFLRTTLRESLREPERHCIIQALKSVSGNKQSAARVLRISRSTLYKKIKEHGLEETEPLLAVSPTAMS